MENTEIRYDGVKLGDTNVVKVFPNICAYGPEDTFDMLLLHNFITSDGKPSYIVLGRFKKDKAPNSGDFAYLQFLNNLNKLLNYRYEDYRDFLDQLRLVKDSNEIANLEFTQEGYDLLTGKYLFEKGSTIQRTVELETIVENGDIIFGKNYYPVNHENKMTHVELFDEWEKYDETYFLNRKDLEHLDPDNNKALMYAIINKDRLFFYMNKYFHKWYTKHNTEMHMITPEEVAKYSLQLLDAVTDFQLEENHELDNGPKK